MGYTIAKRFRFEAAHSLDHLPPGHKCRNLHGHNYEVEIILQSDTLDRYGFVVDFGEVSRIVKPLLSVFDHHNLNDKLTCPPTAEHLAEVIYRNCKADLPQLVAVRVWETPDAYAEYRP